MAKYLTTDTLIASVKRRAMIPQTQNTFTEEDFLAFANEEMDIGITPHILQYHEDYLLQIDYLPLTPAQSYYEIPGRSTGNKVRDVNYVDPSGNVFEMTRVLIEDLPYYQNGGFGIQGSGIRAFYVENDEVVMLPVGRHNLTGFLQVSYYLRPNELVSLDRVATVTGYDSLTGVINVTNIPANLSSLVPMDILQTKGSHKRLLVDTTPSVIASSSMVFGVRPITQITCSAKSAINPSDYLQLIGNGSGVPNSITHSQNNDVINASTFSLNVCVWYDTTGADTAPVQPAGTVFIRVDVSAAVTDVDVVNATVAAITTAAPSHFTASNVSNLLQIDTDLTGTYSYVAIQPTLLFSQVITNTPSTVIPDELVIGDYIALAEECIIPNIPTDLHSMLAQRIACRCLEALGDAAGLQAANAKLAEMEIKTGQLIDNRVEGAPLKVVNRHGFLRQSRRMLRR